MRQLQHHQQTPPALQPWHRQQLRAQRQAWTAGPASAATQTAGRAPTSSAGKAAAIILGSFCVTSLVCACNTPSPVMHVLLLFITASLHDVACCSCVHVPRRFVSNNNSSTARKQQETACSAEPPLSALHPITLRSYYKVRGVSTVHSGCGCRGERSSCANCWPVHDDAGARVAAVAVAEIPCRLLGSCEASCAHHQ